MVQVHVLVFGKSVWTRELSIADERMAGKSSSEGTGSHLRQSLLNGKQLFVCLPSAEEEEEEVNEM